MGNSLGATARSYWDGVGGNTNLKGSGLRKDGHKK